MRGKVAKRLRRIAKGMVKQPWVIYEIHTKLKTHAGNQYQTEQVLLAPQCRRSFYQNIKKGYYAWRKQGILSLM